MSNIVTLPEEIWKRATEIGHERHDQDVRSGSKWGFVPKNRTIRENDAFGARGEAAFSYWLFGKWEPAGLRKADVGRYEVRTTDYQYGWLKFMGWQDKKRNSPFVLMIDQGARKYRVAGWLYGYEIIEKGVRKDTLRERHDAHKGKDMPWWAAEEKYLHTEFPEKAVAQAAVAVKPDEEDGSWLGGE